MSYVKKVAKKYNDFSLVAKVSLWYAFSNFMQKFIVVLGVPIVTRLVSASEYGLYSVYGSWFEIVYNFCTLALASGGYYVGMKKYSESKNRYDSAVMFLCFSITIICFVLLGVFRNAWRIIFSIPISFMLPMFVGIITGCPRDFWAVGERHELRYKRLVSITIFTSVAVLAFQAIMIKLSDRIRLEKHLAIIWGGVIPSILIGVPIMLSIVKKRHTFFDKEIWRETFIFNIILIPYYISITFLNQIDRIMIERMVDAAHAGYYSVAYRAASTINIVTVALNQSLMPWIFKKMKYGGEKDIGRVLTPVMICPFLVSMLMTLLSPEIILVLSGRDYLVASGIIPTVAMGMCYRFVSQIFIDLEMYYEKNKSITGITISVALLNIILNWIFIQKFGFIAAGYTTLVCFMVQAGIHCIVVSKLTKQNRIINMSLIWTFCLTATLLSFVLTFIYDSIFIRYAVLFISIIIAFVFRNKMMDIIKTIRK